MGGFEMFADFYIEGFQFEGAVVDLGLEISPFWAGECYWREEEHGAVDCVGLVEPLGESDAYFRCYVGLGEPCFDCSVHL